jgi:hypothetical protein
LNISQSKVKLFRKCKRAYHYRYVEKLSSNKIAPPLSFGKIVHYILECKAQGIEADLDKFSEEELAGIGTNERILYQEILDNAQNIMVDYNHYWERSPLNHVEIDGSKAEHKIELKINDDITMVGIIDGIVEDDNGRKWLLEHKTGKREMSEEDKWRSLQNAVYYEAMERLDFPPVDGVIWDFILSKEPTKPKLLKSGDVSKAKIVTLPSTVESFIESNPHLSDEDKQDLRAKSIIGLSKYFKRSYNIKNSNVKKSLFDGFVETAEEIVRDHDKSKAMCIDQHCSWCPYRDLCRAELENADVDFVRERNYTTND